MILRGKFSPRRKALLALVLIVLAWLGYAWYANSSSQIGRAHV